MVRYVLVMKTPEELQPLSPEKLVQVGKTIYDEMITWPADERICARCGASITDKQLKSIAFWEADQAESRWSVSHGPGDCTGAAPLSSQTFEQATGKKVEAAKAQASTALTEDEVAATMQEFRTVYFHLESVNASIMVELDKLKDLHARSRRCAERCPEYAVEWWLSLESEKRTEKDDGKWLDDKARNAWNLQHLGFSQDAVKGAVERIKKRSNL
jgi:hypothetical protein